MKYCISSKVRRYIRRVMPFMVLFVLIVVSCLEKHFWGMTIGLLILYVVLDHRRIKQIIDRLGIERMGPGGVIIRPTLCDGDGSKPGGPSSECGATEKMVPGGFPRDQRIENRMAERDMIGQVLERLQNQTGEYFFREMTVEGTGTPTFRFDGVAVDKVQKSLTGVEVLTAEKYDHSLTDRLRRAFDLCELFVRSGKKFDRYSRFILAIVHSLEEADLKTLERDIAALRAEVTSQPEVVLFDLASLEGM